MRKTITTALFLGAMAVALPSAVFAKGFSGVTEVHTGQQAAISAVTNSNVASPVRRAAQRPLKIKGMAAAPVKEKVNRLNPYNPSIRRNAPRAAESNGFQEGFEEWDGMSLNWIPAGWEIISASGEELPELSKWGADAPANYWGYLPDAPEGKYTMAITYDFDSLDQDETLLSPSVKVEENYVLSFQLYCMPFFFFDDSNYDYDTNEFQGPREVKGDLTVEVKVGDGEPKQIWSMMEH